MTSKVLDSLEPSRTKELWTVSRGFVYLKIIIILNYTLFSFTFYLKFRYSIVDPCATNFKAVYNSWFSLTRWDGHVGVEKNGKMSLKFCIIIESNSQKTFFAIILYTNMATVTSHNNREYGRGWTRRWPQSKRRLKKLWETLRNYRISGHRVRQHWRSMW